MYNGSIIEKMLSERKLRKIDLQEALGISYNSYKTIAFGNPTVKTLERVADYFKVSMDVFFERETAFSAKGNNIGSVNGNGNNVQQGHVNVMQDSQEKEIEHLKALLTEKERLIQVLMSKQ